MNSVAGPRAVFGTARTNYPGVQARAQAIANAWGANSGLFAAPPITLIAFIAFLTAFVLAQQAATETKAKGAAKVRNTKCIALWNAMETFQKYIQGLADALGAEAAASLIESGGLLVAKSGAHAKAILAAALTATQGNVLLEANRKLLVGPADASKKATFNWEMSSNGGQTWTALPPTSYASTSVSGLTPMSTYSFRVSVTIGKQPAGPWSQVVSLLVH